MMIESEGAMSDATTDGAQGAEGEGQMSRERLISFLGDVMRTLNLFTKHHWTDKLLAIVYTLRADGKKIQANADKVAALSVILEGADYITLASGTTVLFDDDPVAAILAAAAQAEGDAG